MSKLLKISLAILCIGPAIYLVRLLADPNFRQGFLQNLYADVIVGILITGFITWYIEQGKRADLEVICIIRPIDNNQKQISFLVLNKGNVGFDEKKIYFQLIFTKSYEGVLLGIEALDKIQSKEGKIIYSAKGLLEGPSYPQRPTELCELIISNTKNIDMTDDNWQVRYYLSTPNGMYPASARDGVMQRWDGLGIVRQVKTS